MLFQKDILVVGTSFFHCQYSTVWNRICPSKQTYPNQYVLCRELIRTNPSFELQKFLIINNDSEERNVFCLVENLLIYNIYSDIWKCCIWKWFAWYNQNDTGEIFRILISSIQTQVYIIVIQCYIKSDRISVSHLSFEVLSGNQWVSLYYLR